MSTSNLGTSARSLLKATHGGGRSSISVTEHLNLVRLTGGKTSITGILNSRASYSGDSYLCMWRRAVEQERKSFEFKNIVETSVKSRSIDEGAEGEEEDRGSVEATERKNKDFKKILEVPREERDQVQRLHVIDRAAAAISTAKALLDDNTGLSSPRINNSAEQGSKVEGNEHFTSGKASQHWVVRNSAPGPDFWSWVPPEDNNCNPSDAVSLKAVEKNLQKPNLHCSVMEKELELGFLSIPFESELMEIKEDSPGLSHSWVDRENNEEDQYNVLSTAHPAEAACALDNAAEASTNGVNDDGSRWWKETGLECKPDGVICRWTLTRGISADNLVEWEEKFWEAADNFDYKELGCEKSGRDSAGNIWHEYWRESMKLELGIVHIEKTAEKWGKNTKSDEWNEKWWEHYTSSGMSEKWAHKWGKIDPNSYLDPGHAHVWHERWGEKYDGHGGSMKYSDKWSERCEGEGWTKWGDKWDEDFDLNGSGVKHGETWWRGGRGEQWNRTWGEQHDGSGWVHKYGKSSSGEHWDTSVQEKTWYERYPHYGFWHCFENSVQLSVVRRPDESR